MYKYLLQSSTGTAFLYTNMTVNAKWKVIYECVVTLQRTSYSADSQNVEEEALQCTATRAITEVLRAAPCHSWEGSPCPRLPFLCSQ